MRLVGLKINKKHKNSQAGNAGDDLSLSCARCLESGYTDVHDAVKRNKYIDRYTNVEATCSN